MTPVVASPRVRRLTLSTLIVVALLTLLWPVTWPTNRLLFGGADASYAIGLHLAAARHLVYGRDIVFTYGPLGFLDFPWFVTPATGVLAVLTSVISRAALIGMVWTLARRTLGTAAATVATYVFVALASIGVYIVWFATSTTWLILASLWAIVQVTREQPTSSVRGTAVAAAIASVSLLVKLDSGLAILCMVALAMILVGLRQGGVRCAVRNVAIVAVVSPVTVALVWVLIGQPLSALPDWARGSTEIVTGFARDMGSEDPGRRWQYFAALIAVGALLAAIATGKRLSRRLRMDALVVVVVTIGFAFRQGFVRHDLHAVEFFAVVAFLPIAFLHWWRGVVSVCVTGGLTVLLLSVGHGSLGHQLSPTWRLARMDTSIRLLVSRGERRETIAASRTSLRRSYGIPDEIGSRLNAASVHIRGTETAVQFAYGGKQNWNPLPVFQDYQAYTGYLDDLNAKKLEGRGRPTYVLTGPTTVRDRRLPRWQSPEATLQLLCHYDLEMESANHAWLLARSSAGHCGRRHGMQMTKQKLGRPVVAPTPSANEIVLVRFSGIGTSFSERIRTAVFKASWVWLRASNSKPYRFVVGTQSQWHVLSAPRCAVPLLDGDFPPNLSAFSIAASPGGRGRHVGYTAEFARMTYRCGPRVEIVGSRH